MKVTHSNPVANGHSVEIGQASWDENAFSIRNRYKTANGGFSPRSSSEFPISDLVPLAKFAAQHDKLSISECMQIITALSESVLRQNKWIYSKILIKPSLSTKSAKKPDFINIFAKPLDPMGIDA